MDDTSFLEWAFDMDDGIKGGFLADLGVNSTYDSNFRLEENNAESEITTLVSPRIRYNTDPEGGAPITLSASYLPIYRSYHDNSDLDGFDQSGDVSVRAVGAKTVLTATARYSEVSSTDRITRTFITGSLFNLGVSGTYQIAPRTLLSASRTLALSDYSGRSAVGSEIHSTRFGALWAATERLSVGPSIRYNLSESDNTDDIKAWAAFFETQYRAGERVRLVASLGVEHTSTVSNDSAGLTGGLSASYRFSERWAWRNSIRYVTVPSPTETDYVIHNFGASTQLTRELLRGSLAFGLDLNISEYERTNGEDNDLDRENNLSALISYARPLFTERLDFQSSIRYSINDGGADWSQFQLTAGIVLSF